MKEEIIIEVLRKFRSDDSISEEDCAITLKTLMAMDSGGSTKRKSRKPRAKKDEPADDQQEQQEDDNTANLYDAQQA